MSRLAAQQDALDELFVDLRTLEKVNASKRLSRRIALRLQPLVTFVDRYAVAVDVAIQGTPSPATLIWGSLRALLIAIKTYSQYFDHVLATLEKLGMATSNFSKYEGLLGHEEIFRESLRLVYADVFSFLEHSKKILQKSGLTIFVRSIWQDFEGEFSSILKTIHGRIEVLQQQTTYVYRRNLLKLVQGNEEQAAQMSTAVLDISGQDYGKRLERWLSPVLANEYLVQASARKLCPGGLWIQDSSEFTSWRQLNSGLLWIHGPPGSGKTVLSSSIIKVLDSSLNDLDRLCYFFCDFANAERNTKLRFCASLLFQLTRLSSDVPSALKQAFKKAQQKGQTTISELDQPIELLISIMERHESGFIVIDGLDEAEEAGAIANVVQQLIEATNSVKVIILSRDTPALRLQFGSCPKIQLTRANCKADLKAFLSLALAQLEQQKDTDVASSLLERLEAKSEGNFLWTRLMLQSLETATSPHDIDQIVDQPVLSIDDMYAKPLFRLSRLSLAERTLAKRLIYWICCSTKPLTMPELQTAMATCSQTQSFEVRRKPFTIVVRSLCSDLFEVDYQTQTYRPFHASVAEYLLGESNKSSIDDTLGEFRTEKSEAHQRIALESLALLQTAFGPLKMANTAFSKPLTKHVSLGWIDHLLKSSRTDTAANKVAFFLQSGSGKQWISYYLLWQQGILPFQRLLNLRSRLVKWLKIQELTVPFPYMDWAFEITLALLNVDKSIPQSCEPINSCLNCAETQLEQFSHFEKMMVIRDLARHFTQSGRVQDGIDLFESALRETSNEDVDAVWMLNSVSLFHDQIGQIDRAVQIQEQALEVLIIGRFGNSSEDSIRRKIIWTKDELGRLYRHQGRYGKAENMHLEAIAALEALPSDILKELELSWAESTLARVYRKQARFDESIAMSEEALKTRQKIQGCDHPHCLWILSDIAQCYLNKGETVHAAKLHQEAYHARMVALGEEHPDTLWTMNNLGVALAATKDGNAKARVIQQQAFEMQARVLGANHPHTRWTGAFLQTLD